MFCFSPYLGTGRRFFGSSRKAGAWRRDGTDIVHLAALMGVDGRSVALMGVVGRCGMVMIQRSSSDPTAPETP